MGTSRFWIHGIAVLFLVVGVSPVAHGRTTDTSLEKLVEKCLPSVVSIEIQGPLHIHKGKNGKVHDSKSRGSGFFIHEDGSLITNHHVIENAKSIEVILASGQRRKATVVGSDSETDVALLQVDLEGLVISPVPFGDATSIKVGEEVFAIGNPLGLSHSVSRGVISALHRDSIKPRKEHKYSDFIQTDAAINKGSSGGPLFNMKGEVLGMNTAIKKKGRGLAFSIPSNWIQDLLPLLKAGTVERSWLGVAVSLTSDSIEGPDSTIRLRVGRVVEDSPAAEADLKKGDVLEDMNGEPFQSLSDFKWRMAMAGIGTEVTLNVKSEDGNVNKVGVVLTGRPLNKKAPETPIKLYGTDDIGKFWGLILAKEKRGLVVEQVLEDSAAEKAGVQSGDQVVRVGNDERLTLNGVLRAVQERKKSRILELELKRNDRRYYVPLYAP
jgi:serine protease Do